MISRPEDHAPRDHAHDDHAHALAGPGSESRLVSAAPIDAIDAYERAMEAMQEREGSALVALNPRQRQQVAALYRFVCQSAPECAEPIALLEHNARRFALAEKQAPLHLKSIDPVRCYRWLQTRGLEPVPVRRPRPGPVKATGMPPPGELVPAEEMHAFASAFGGSA